MKVETKNHKLTPTGSETTAKSVAGPGKPDAGEKPAVDSVYDRRGVKLPAKALVGGIITPQ